MHGGEPRSRIGRGSLLFNGDFRAARAERIRGCFRGSSTGWSGSVGAAYVVDEQSERGCTEENNGAVRALGVPDGHLAEVAAYVRDFGQVDWSLPLWLDLNQAAPGRSAAVQATALSGICVSLQVLLDQFA